MSNLSWSPVSKRRLSRRRALGAAGSLAASAAFLVACGRGDSGDKAVADKSGLLTTLTDTTSAARRGGILPLHKTDGAQSIDPITTVNASAFNEIGPIYSTLIRFGRHAERKIPGATTIAGEATQSWEISPDGLRVTHKLRPNFRFDRRSPTNGRAMNAQDIKYSWDRTVATSPYIGDLLRARNEAGPVESMSTPDSQTVVFKQAFPYGGLNYELAHWYLYVVPIEAEDKFDIKREAHGTGPYYLQKWEPSVLYEFRRNPDWYEKDRPFFDGIDKTIVADPVAALAQLEAKRFWVYERMKQDDVLRVKRDHSEMDLFENPPLGIPGANFWTFSTRPNDPFRDVRLRRALSMLIDRDLFIDTFNNVSQFRDAGLPTETPWHSHISHLATNYIDPRDSKYGEGGKYFRFDPAEAKKLIAASGFNDTLKINFRNQRGTFLDSATVIAQMWEANGGLKVRMIPLAVETSWAEARVSGGESYDHVFYNICRGTSDEALLTSKYTPDGANAISKKPVPEITSNVLKIRAELDVRKQNDLVKQLQRDLASLMPDIMIEGNIAGFNVKWPWLKNYGVFAAAGFQPDYGASSARLLNEYWYDASAKT
jgi:peptide/nickel transport system substrate-binding protein